MLCQCSESPLGTEYKVAGSAEEALAMPQWARFRASASQQRSTAARDSTLPQRSPEPGGPASRASLAPATGAASSALTVADTCWSLVCSIVIQRDCVHRRSHLVVSLLTTASRNILLLRATRLRSHTQNMQGLAATRAFRHAAAAPASAPPLATPPPGAPAPPPRCPTSAHSPALRACQWPPAPAAPRPQRRS